MHMVCIRPELKEFVVGSSCDYSFIPEMCPSGNVYAMTDFDDYLVVEMQKRGHERNFVRLGAVNQPILTESLAEWATATHRKNAHSAVVFHAADLSPVLDKVVAESGAYIDEIERLLPKPPPHRNHPYWMGAMAAYEWAVAQRQNAARPRTAADMLQSRATGFNWWLYRVPQRCLRPSSPGQVVASALARLPDVHGSRATSFFRQRRVIADHFQRAGRIWQLPERCIAVGRFARSEPIPHAQSRAIQTFDGII